MPVVVCSLGDASVTEGEVSEAFQFAALKKLPVIFLVQDNNRGISVTSEEARVTDVYGFAEGMPGISRLRINGENFADSYTTMGEAIKLCANKSNAWRCSGYSAFAWAIIPVV